MEPRINDKVTILDSDNHAWGGDTGKIVGESDPQSGFDYDIELDNGSIVSFRRNEFKLTEWE